MAQYKQGYFKPRNPQRYKGNATDIVYRSSLELKFLMYLDSHPQVIRYASEEGFMVVTYVNPLTGRSHRYFPDMWFQKKDKNGIVKTFLVEVKPHSETLPPTKPKDARSSKRFMRQAATYAINRRKWDAAEAVCAKKGWEFKIITDRHLK